MKRLICLLLCAAAVICFSACGEDNDKDTKTASSPDQVKSSTPVEPTDAPEPTEPGDTERLKEFIRNFDTAPTAEEQLLYEDDAITVHLNALAYDRINGPELQLRVTNNYAKDLVMQCPYTVVNGWMITPQLEMTIPAGKTTEGVLNIPYFYLAISGVNSVRTIELPLTFSDTLTFELVKTTDLITITTSAPQDGEAAFPEDGQVAYDKGGVKILIKGMNTDHTYSDDEKLVVMIYNGSDREIVVKPKEVNVNGYDDLIPMMHRNILPGKQAADVVRLAKSDLDEHGISDIDSIRVSFGIFNTDPWKELGSTDLITVDLTLKDTIIPATPDSATK